MRLPWGEEREVERIPEQLRGFLGESEGTVVSKVQ